MSTAVSTADQQTGAPAHFAANSSSLIVVFRLAGQEYGLPADSVTEIIRFRGLTRVPNAPECIAGVINLRGRVVPLFSLYRRLKLEERRQPAGGERAVMVVEYAGEEAGLLVDEVTDVLKTDDAALDYSAREAELHSRRQFIDGTVIAGERLITLLQIAALLED